MKSREGFVSNSSSSSFLLVSKKDAKDPLDIDVKINLRDLIEMLDCGPDLNSEMDPDWWNEEYGQKVEKEMRDLEINGDEKVDYIYLYSDFGQRLGELLEGSAIKEEGTGIRRVYTG